MPIEITGPFTPKPGTAGEGTSVLPLRGENTSAAPNKSGAATQDTVKLTQTAALMQRLDADIAAAPGVDAARVDAIRKAIATGTFTVDAGRVAEKLVRFEAALHIRKRP